VFEIARTAGGYASTPTTLVSFNVGNGASPESGLVADSAGNLFGTAAYGGAFGYGTVFELSNAFTALTVAINGVAEVGQTLTAVANGSVGSYQWQKLVGGTWTNIAGATGASYVMQGSDLGTQIQVRVAGNGSLTATSTPVANIAPASTLEITGASNEQVAFAPNGTQTGGTLQLDLSSLFSGQINGFGGTDKIDLRDIGFGAATTVGYQSYADNSGGRLSVSDGTHVASLALLGQYAASMFSLSSDGHGGTTVVDYPITTQTTLAASLV